MSALSTEWTNGDAVIFRNDLPWAKLAWGADDGGHGEPCWTVTPMVESRKSHFDHGTPVALSSARDRDDRESAVLAAMVEVGKPNFRPPPAFAKDPALWAHVKAKNPRPYDEWTPPDFAAATRIYRYSERKYGVGNVELGARYGVAFD